MAILQTQLCPEIEYYQPFENQTANRMVRQDYTVLYKRKKFLSLFSCINQSMYSNGPFKNWTGNRMVLSWTILYKRKNVLILFACINELG
jgi:hypothetical protein